MFYKDLSTERKFRVLDVNFLKKDSLKYLFFRLDYCNSFLSGCFKNSLKNSQLIHNAKWDYKE